MADDSRFLITTSELKMTGFVVARTAEVGVPRGCSATRPSSGAFSLGLRSERAQYALAGPGPRALSTSGIFLPATTKHVKSRAG